jgi:hypothetical protein
MPRLRAPFDNSAAILISPMIGPRRFAAKFVEEHLQEPVSFLHVKGFSSNITKQNCQLTTIAWVNDREAGNYARSRQRGSNVQRSNQVLSQFNSFERSDELVLSRSQRKIT